MKKLLFTIATACALASTGFCDGSENGYPIYDGVVHTEKYPSLAQYDKTLLYADQYGNLSSTNAIATSAEIAAVSASNVVAQGIQRANAEGYATATNLMTQIANSLANSPIVFACLELASFTGAITFDVETSKCTIFAWNIDNGVTEMKTVGANTFECTRITCGYAFTSNIDGLKPLIPYCEQLDAENVVSTANEANWEFLNDALVDAPVPVEGTPYTAQDGTRFTNFYEIHLWIPTDRISGFFRISCKPEIIEGDGNVLDTVGVVGGATGTVTNGTVVLNMKGGYIMQNGTEQLTIGNAANSVNLAE